MGLDYILELLKWPMGFWLFVRLFWHKNDLGTHLDAWAKCDPLLLDKKNLLQDLEALDYLKHHDLIKLYSSNLCNIQRKKYIQTLFLQALSCTFTTLPKI